MARYTNFSGQYAVHVVCFDTLFNVIDTAIFNLKKQNSSALHSGRKKEVEENKEEEGEKQ